MRRARCSSTETVRLASALGLQTIAEGVESQAQLETLRRMGCGGWQGYLCSPAVPPQEVDELLRLER